KKKSSYRTNWLILWWQARPLQRYVFKNWVFRRCAFECSVFKPSIFRHCVLGLLIKIRIAIMSYKHRALQAHQAKSDGKSSMIRKSGAQKLVTALLTALPMFAVLGAGASLSGCGFQLRGYDAPMLF